jgi:hypothetical protein
LGELSAGALADMVAIPFAGAPVSAWDAIVHHAGPVSESWIAGESVSPHF